MNIADYSTYETGILQARAYRNLRAFMQCTLKEYTLTSVQWSVLGVVTKRTPAGGIRASELADMLNVERSFIANVTKKLHREGYIAYGRDEDDGRVRVLLATPKAESRVKVIEKHMRKRMKVWLEDIDTKDLMTYISVLGQLSNKVKI